MKTSPVRVAILGAGHWGPNLIRALHNRPASEVGWVIDRDQQRLKQVVARFPDIHVDRDAQRALEDVSIDAAVVATPTRTHFPLARAALENDKHILLEKPMTDNAADARTLCRLAANRRRTLMVGHLFIYNPAIRQVKEYIDKGLLGRVYYISMTRTNLGPIRGDVNAAWDLASHDISIANYWLGANSLGVSARGGAWINAGLEDAVFATLRYPRNVLVNMHVSWLSPRKVREITIVGDRRMLTFDDMNLNEPVRLYDKQVRAERTPHVFTDSFASFRASIREGTIMIPRIALGEPLREECAHFIESVRTGRQPLTAGTEGLAVVCVLEAMRRSMRKAGREEKV